MVLFTLVVDDGVFNLAINLTNESIIIILNLRKISDKRKKRKNVPWN